MLTVILINSEMHINGSSRHCSTTSYRYSGAFCKIERIVDYLQEAWIWRIQLTDMSGYPRRIRMKRDKSSQWRDLA